MKPKPDNRITFNGMPSPNPIALDRFEEIFMGGKCELAVEGGGGGTLLAVEDTELIDGVGIWSSETEVENVDVVVIVILELLPLSIP